MLKKGDDIYEIPLKNQHDQAWKAHLGFDGARSSAWDVDLEKDAME